MAAAPDVCEDLDELCSENDELTEQFAKAANHLQTLLPSVDNEMLLTLYGYYKQGNEGRCNVPKPSWYDMKGKAKWEAWNKLGDIPQLEAKMLYVQQIEQLDPGFKDGNVEIQAKDGWVTVSTLQQKDIHINEGDKTIVDYVKDGQAEKVAEILKKKKSDINWIDMEGLGLIHWASDRGSVEILKTLVQYEADVNLQDVDGQTALHYASSCGYQDCVQFLLEKGCDPHATDADGSTPIDVASDNHIKEILANKSLPLKT